MSSQHQDMNPNLHSRTERVFSSTAVAYDGARARLIPCFSAFYEAAVSLLPSGTDHVLDLGAGTGLLSAYIRERFPDAYLEMIDNSEPMLAQARQRFSLDQETAFLLGDYTTHPWGSEYDAVVSALSIHHLSDEAKRALFARVLSALKPGGVFINAEQILQPTPELEVHAKTAWLDEVRGLGATEQQIADSLPASDRRPLLHDCGSTRMDAGGRPYRRQLHIRERPFCCLFRPQTADIGPLTPGECRSGSAPRSDRHGPPIAKCRRLSRIAEPFPLEPNT